jgi:hypothetical protein
VISRMRPDDVLGTVTLEDVHRAYGITDCQRSGFGAK